MWWLLGHAQDCMYQVAVYRTTDDWEYGFVTELPAEVYSTRSQIAFYLE